MKYIYLLLGVGVMFTSCKNSDHVKTANYAVKTAKPTNEEFVSSTHEYPFIIKPYNESGLSFRISGPLTNFDLKAGDQFRKGDVILSVDSRDFLIRKQQTEAIWYQTKQEYNRIKALYEAGNISGSNFERAKAEFLVAEANYKNAENALEDTKLKAPFTGFVQDIYVQPFQDVKASERVMTFIELDRLKAEVYVPQTIARVVNTPELSKEVKIGVVFDTKPKEVVIPTHIEMSKSTTDNHLSYKLTATLDNKDGAWLGGMSGKIQISLPDSFRRNVVLIPQSGLNYTKEFGDYVWVVKDGKVSRRSIILGAQRGTMFEVKSGLTAQDEIVLTRKSFLTENSAVTIQR